MKVVGTGTSSSLVLGILTVAKALENSVISETGCRKEVRDGHENREASIVTGASVALHEPRFHLPQGRLGQTAPSHLTCEFASKAYNVT